MSLADRRCETDNVADLNQVRSNLQEIARAEITRHRRRLGPLTEEQQSAIEELLISTADQISGRLIQFQKYPSELRAQCLNVWNSKLVA